MNKQNLFFGSVAMAIGCLSFIQHHDTDHQITIICQILVIIMGFVMVLGELHRGKKKD